MTYMGMGPITATLILLVTEVACSLAVLAPWIMLYVLWKDYDGDPAIIMVAIMAAVVCLVELAIAGDLILAYMK